MFTEFPDFEVVGAAPLKMSNSPTPPDILFLEVEAEADKSNSTKSPKMFFSFSLGLAGGRGRGAVSSLSDVREGGSISVGSACAETSSPNS